MSMKKIGIGIVVLIILSCTSVNVSGDNTPMIANIVFSSASEAKEHLKTDDLFLRSLSAFDRAARLRTSRVVDMEEFVKFISQQTLDWTVQEKKTIDNVMIRVNRALSEFNMHFPDEIILIKTTGLEEGNAAYCRGNNIIVFPEEFLNLPFDRLYGIMLHELFHIFTRNNREIQEELFGILSFFRASELQLPDDIFQWKITNPDAVENNYYFTGNINGNEYKLMPILLASSNYDENRGGRFFDYLGLYFIAVYEDGDKTIPLSVDDGYVIFTPNQVPDYLNIVGRNTNYIIHPEEVLADNFVLLVNNARNLPNMEIIEKMKLILKRP